jgi:hypothetical protein
VCERARELDRAHANLRGHESEALFVNDARLKEAKMKRSPMVGGRAHKDLSRCVFRAVFLLGCSARRESSPRGSPLAHFPVFPRLCLDPDDPNRITDETRALGMVVCRGTQVRGRY